MKNTNHNTLQGLRWREETLPSDIIDIREIIISSGFFSNDEVGIATELVEERLLKGVSSGYYFLFLEMNGKLTGYSCFGPIPGTIKSYDLYWIALKNEFRGLGLGSMIMEMTENKIKSMGGERVYIETSSRDQYRPTRIFYDTCGYIEEARLIDFYSPGDDKIIFVKDIGHLPEYISSS